MFLSQPALPSQNAFGHSWFPMPRFWRSPQALPLQQGSILGILGMLGVLGLFLMALASDLQANEVTARGEALILQGNQSSARQQALHQAQRAAIEQGVGALVDAQTLAKNFEIVEDQIYSSSQGFIETYRILEEGPTANGQSYRVQIQATVRQGSLRDRLAALRILQQKMGNQRMMILYRPRDPDALPATSGAVRDATIALRSFFNQKGFRVFNEEQTNQVYQKMEQASLIDRPANDLLALALDHRVEVLVEFELVAGKRGRRGGRFYATQVTLKMGAYDTGTGRQIVDVVTYGKELATTVPGEYEQHQMLGKASRSAGEKAAEKAVPQIANHYQSVEDRGFAYHLVFRNFSADEEDEILDYLEGSPGFKGLSEISNAPNYLEIELFSTQSKSRLRRKIRRDLKDQSIYFTTQETSGNRLVLIRRSE